MPLVLIILAAVGLWIYGWPEFLTKYTYRAEVGYYEGDKQAWYVGPDKSYDACISEAQGVFSNYNAKSPNRAFSWSCRKMQGESFLERVR